MPGLDGFDTCRRLRAMPGFEFVPVLMLTGLEDDESISRAYRAGATDFFVKSTQWSLLNERLRYMLRSSRMRMELERSKGKLARAQDLARMGSFDWRRFDGGLVVQPEGLRVLGLMPGGTVTLRRLLHLVRREEREALFRLLRERLRHSSVLATDVTTAQPGCRQRVIHV